MDDPRSLELCVRLYMEDILFIRDCAADQTNHGGDYAYSCEVFEHELRQLNAEAADMALAASVAEAVRTDNVLVAAVHLEEESTAYDREVALALAEDREAPVMPPALIDAQEDANMPLPATEDAEKNEGSVGEQKDDVERVEERPKADESEEEVELTLNARRGPKPKLKCAACLENLTSKTALQVSCGHYYDSGCLRELYLQATTDETLMPPRCCGENINITVVEAYMSDREYELFVLKHDEWSTQDRLYCPDPACATFVGAAPKDGTEQVRCHACHTSICLDCRGHAHEEQGRCQGDEALKEVLALGEAEGWKR